MSKSPDSVSEFPASLPSMSQISVSNVLPWEVEMVVEEPESV